MKKSKILPGTICAALLVVLSVVGTLAYLTSRDTVVNTFTVGKVDITVDESKVTLDGEVVQGADRVKENKYHLVPGKTYMKDPTMTVIKGSEESYVRMLVTINCKTELDAAFAPEGAELKDIFQGYDATNWIYVATSRDTSTNTVTYEFRYKETVEPTTNADLVLEPLFDSIVVPSSFGSDEMASIEELKITVVGHAIQAVGFANEDAAWTAFADEVDG